MGFCAGGSTLHNLLAAHFFLEVALLEVALYCLSLVN